ncbi:hypothetical protein ACGFR8_07675 [Streptomyces brevispora]|uniref:hypothetical protein n=1 Tax=Streptomyces brevispora TaxID=887462 RepID=UPI003711EF74
MTRELDATRVEEIQALVRQLTTAPVGDPAPLLDYCRTALTDLLADRDDLIRSHAETAEELALWTGTL